MTTRFFLVVHPLDSELQRLLDAIRFIANPNEKTRAHITLRGPYSQRYSVERIEQRLQGTNIQTLGVDSFFGDNQNTVFLRCDSRALRETHSLKDYGYNPHITLYDGASREFATAMLDRLQEISLEFSFRARAPSYLTSIKSQRTFELFHAFEESDISQYLGEDIADVESFQPSERVRLVGRLAERLPGISDISNFEEVETSKHGQG